MPNYPCQSWLGSQSQDEETWHNVKGTNKKSDVEVVATAMLLLLLLLRLITSLVMTTKLVKMMTK